MENTKPIKTVWTEKDFDQMGWHDNKIYAITFNVNNSEISLDIDYILQWINPEKGETDFKFKVAPSTLVFRNIYNLKIDFPILDNLFIEDIYRNNPSKPKNAKHIKEQIEYEWTIETGGGDLIFNSVGFKQVLRKSPILINKQNIDLIRRE